MRLALVASKPTDSVTFGFLPAAARLGLEVVLLTDQPAEHERVLAKSRLLPRPGCAPPDEVRLADTGPVRIVGCDVWDARGLVSAIAALSAQDAIFSNSDHLQTQTALAAAYFDVPGKDWRSAMRVKNKPLMRRRLAGTGTEHVAATEIRPGDRDPVPVLAYPVVLKPAEGVASEDVILVRDRDELREQCALIFARRPGEVLLAEQYLPGELRTLETLSDGAATWVLGGFRTRVSPLPFFIEERLTWDCAAPEAASEHVTRSLTALGATFGACHTEYVLGPGHPPALIEVNDRLIGDHCDFLLSDLLGTDLFECLLRLYLGEPLPPGPPPVPEPHRAHAVIDYVIAERPGVLSASPKAGARVSGEPGVLLCCRPLRAEGDRIEVTRTNRDYVGAVTAIGPDAAAVDLAVAALRATERWEITGSGR